MGGFTRWQWVVSLGGNRLWVVVVASIGSRLWWPVEQAGRMREEVERMREERDKG